MNKFIIRDTCDVFINKKDETPVIIFKDVPLKNIIIENEKIEVNLNVDDSEFIKDIIKQF